MAGQWRKIDDNPPKDGTWLLLWCPGQYSGGEEHEIGFWRDGSGWVSPFTQGDCDDEIPLDPTHWQHLPAAP